MSFWELSVVIIIGLLVIGPARLPEAIKTGYTWFARVKRAVNDAKTEFEQHIGADEIRRELHNEKILKSLSELKTLKSDLEKSTNKIHGDNHPELSDEGHNNYLEHEANHDLSNHDDHHDEHHNDYHNDHHDEHHHDHHDEHHQPAKVVKQENEVKNAVKIEKPSTKAQAKNANTTAHSPQKSVTNTETEHKIS